MKADCKMKGKAVSGPLRPWKAGSKLNCNMKHPSEQQPWPSHLTVASHETLFPHTQCTALWAKRERCVQQEKHLPHTLHILHKNFILTSRVAAYDCWEELGKLERLQCASVSVDMQLVAASVQLLESAEPISKVKLAFSHVLPTAPNSSC